MDGYKTIILAGVASFLNLLTAFGVGLSDVQVDAVQNFLNVFLIPAAMVWVRMRTDAPVGDLLSRWQK